MGGFSEATVSIIVVRRTSHAPVLPPQVLADEKQAVQHRAEEWERLLRRTQDEADTRIATVRGTLCGHSSVR